MTDSFRDRWIGKLDPCRFCGYTVPMLSAEEGWFNLTCLDCGARGPTQKTEDAAARAWNGAWLKETSDD